MTSHGHISPVKISHETAACTDIAIAIDAIITPHVTIAITLTPHAFNTRRHASDAIIGRDAFHYRHDVIATLPDIKTATLIAAITC
jgi:hypothetical protein